MGKVLKNNHYYLLTISFILLSTIFLGPVSLIMNVSADEDDLAVKEGDIFKWQITKFEIDDYEILEVGDTMIIRIEWIEYFKEEDMWYIRINKLDFEEEEGEDKFYDSSIEVYEDGSDTYDVDEFIPSKDVKQYLKDHATTGSSLIADEYKLNETEVSSGETIEYISEYNDLGILIKYTKKIDGNIVKEYELMEGGISFGITFLFFIPIGILVYIFIIKKKGEWNKY